MLLTEYNYMDKHNMIATYVSIHGIPLAKTFLQQILNEQNGCSYDLIAISDVLQKTTIDDEQSSSLTIHPSQGNTLSNRKLFLNPHVSELSTISAKLNEIEKTLQVDKASDLHTFILLDQLTPLTIGNITEIKYI